MFKKFLTMAIICAVVLSVGVIVSADEITWSLNANNELIIEGSGEMTSAPWNDEIDVNKVEKIIIEDGITSICDNAFCIFNDQIFAGYENLKSVEIPDSVTEIGMRAFGWAENLTDVKLPSNLKKLGMVAFMGTGIEQVTIPATLTQWDRTAFGQCKSLTDVTISDGLTKIPEYTFFGCDALTSIVVPDSVVYIEGYAFASCISLENIYLPDGIVAIGEYAFDECESLKEITIPSSVKMLNYSLENWYLETVNYKGLKTEWQKIQGNSIGAAELVCRNETLNFTLTADENGTTLSWNNYHPSATGYDLVIFAYDEETSEYESVATHNFAGAATFNMEANGYTDGLYIARLWVYLPYPEFSFEEMMWFEEINFAIGEANDQSTYALTNVEIKEMASGKLYVQAEVVERGNRNKSDMFVIAVYNDGEMKDMAFVTGDLLTGTPFTFGGIVEGADGADVKAFVWDGIETMKCLSNVVER